MVLMLEWNSRLLFPKVDVLPYISLYCFGLILSTRWAGNLFRTWQPWTQVWCHSQSWVIAFKEWISAWAQVALQNTLQSCHFQKGGILTPSGQDVWKLVCMPYCSWGTKKSQESIMSAAWIFLYSDNLWRISTKKHLTFQIPTQTE